MSEQSRWANLKDDKRPVDQRGSQLSNRPSSSQLRSGSQQSRWASLSTSEQATAVDKRDRPNKSIQHDIGPSRGLAPPTGLTTRNTSRPLGGKGLDRMALLASPSRGLDASSQLSADLLSQGSMDLTNADVQNELRAYIATQIATRVLPALTNAKPPRLKVLDTASYLPTNQKGGVQGVSKADEELQQIVLLTRKLREAVVASKRSDSFVTDVYCLSVHLALLCMDVPQLMTSLSRLVLDLLPSTDSTPSSVTSSDITIILQHIEAPFNSTQCGNGKANMASLLLLQTLCLSGKASRLGQYASTAPAQTALHSQLPSMSSSLREYRSLRAQLGTLYPESGAVFQLCDQVYKAVRDSNPFLLSHLLEQEQLDIWQRILLMQLIPTIRARAWTMARKAYMYLPISSSLAHQVNPQHISDQTQTDSSLLESLVLLSTSYLVPTAAEMSREAQAQNRSPSPEPDDWEEDDTAHITNRLAQTSLHSASLASSINDSRVRNFLQLEFGGATADGTAQRVMQIREGFAFKIR